MSSQEYKSPFSTSKEKKFNGSNGYKDEGRAQWGVVRQSRKALPFLWLESPRGNVLILCFRTGGLWQSPGHWQPGVWNHETDVVTAWDDSCTNLTGKEYRQNILDSSFPLPFSLPLIKWTGSQWKRNPRNVVAGSFLYCQTKQGKGRDASELYQPREWPTFLLSIFQ